jgi:hypothetical protein
VRSCCLRIAAAPGHRAVCRLRPLRLLPHGRTTALLSAWPQRLRLPRAQDTFLRGTDAVAAVAEGTQGGEAELSADLVTDVIEHPMASYVLTTIVGFLLCGSCLAHQAAVVTLAGWLAD